MSASYYPVAGHVVPDAACQRVRVWPVVFELGERLPSLRRMHLVIVTRMSAGVGFFHADETSFFEPTAKKKTEIPQIKTVMDQAPNTGPQTEGDDDRSKCPGRRVGGRKRRQNGRNKNTVFVTVLKAETREK